MSKTFPILHPSKRHPLTGLPLEAIWVRPDGKVVWPIMGGSEETPPAGEGAPADGDEGKGGKTAVLADLAKERKARQELEKQVADLAPLKDQMTALAAALGVKPDKAGEPDAVTQIQQQLDAIQRENALLQVAATHGITNKSDLDHLRAVTDPQAQASLAERLASQAQKPGTPKPDATQGGAGEPSRPDPGPGVSRLRSAYAEAETSNA